MFSKWINLQAAVTWSMFDKPQYNSRHLGGGGCSLGSCKQPEFNKTGWQIQRASVGARDCVGVGGEPSEHVVQAPPRLARAWKAAIRGACALPHACLNP